jgi:hypothetical protein
MTTVPVRRVNEKKGERARTNDIGRKGKKRRKATTEKGSTHRTDT